MAVSFPPKWWRIQEGQKRGAKLIVVDPRKNEVAREADQWLKIKPATDDALPGWLNVIITEKRYDEPFLLRWTNAPFLVRTDEMKLLRESDIRAAGTADNFVAWDPGANSPVVYSTKDLDYEKSVATPALSGPLKSGWLAAKRLHVRRFGKIFPGRGGVYS